MNHCRYVEQQVRRIYRSSVRAFESRFVRRTFRAKREFAFRAKRRKYIPRAVWHWLCRNYTRCLVITELRRRKLTGIEIYARDVPFYARLKTRDPRKKRAINCAKADAGRRKCHDKSDVVQFYWNFHQIPLALPPVRFHVVAHTGVKTLSCNSITNTCWYLNLFVLPICVARSILRASSLRPARFYISESANLNVNYNIKINKNARRGATLEIKITKKEYKKGKFTN